MVYTFSFIRLIQICLLMKNHRKNTLNSLEEVLTEINDLIAQKEKEDYARIFIKQKNLSTTYQSYEYLTIVDIRSTLLKKNIFWCANFSR